MIAIPEMRIQKALQDGFAAIATNLDLLDDLFFNYPPEMRAEVKQYLKEHVITVLLNWPKSGQTLPVIGIVNAADVENPGNDVLGDMLEELEAMETDATITEYRGLAMNGTYQMLIQAGDPRLTLLLSYLVTTLLILASPALVEAGLHNVTLSQADLRFEENLLPEWVNARMVTLTCLHYHAVPVTERLMNSLNVVVSA